MVSRHQSRPDDLELPKYCIELLYDQKYKAVESTGGTANVSFHEIHFEDTLRAGL
jgi:hypothetical protein